MTETAVSETRLSQGAHKTSVESLLKAVENGGKLCKSYKYGRNFHLIILKKIKAEA